MRLLASRSYLSVWCTSDSSEDAFIAVSLDGRLKRAPYALLTAAVFFSQHLVTLGILSLQGEPWDLGPTFVFMPLRATVTHGNAATPVVLLVLAYALLVAWVLTVLASRRSNDAGYDGMVPQRPSRRSCRSSSFWTWRPLARPLHPTSPHKERLRQACDRARLRRASSSAWRCSSRSWHSAR